MKNRQNISAGDTVEVLTPSEILRTLDPDGALDGVPFMPEMVETCGKRFRVLRKVSRTCVACLDPDITFRIAEFVNNDVFFLEGLRCSGLYHDNCSRGCSVFWKGAWLRKVEDGYPSPTFSMRDAAKLHDFLAVKMKDEKYFCQSTQLEKATVGISRCRKVTKVIEDLCTGGCTGLEAARAAFTPVGRKVLQMTVGPATKGCLSKTPSETLNLQVGELVEVKSLAEITATLDERGRNRGLEFVPGMKKHCGKRFRVRNRMERLILEHCGEMTQLKDTVILEGNTCTYDQTFGGCPRNEFNYWREIWLKRVEDPQ